MRLLTELSVGEHARVSKINGSDQISQRLLEMGLTPGIDVSVIGTAPLGDPLELELRGYRLGVRRSEAQRVEVESI